MTKAHQTQIQSILDAKKIQYELVDISVNETAKELMKERNLLSDIPQFEINGIIKGGYSDFENAIEEESLNKFLEL